MSILVALGAWLDTVLGVGARFGPIAMPLDTATIFSFASSGHNFFARLDRHLAPFSSSFKSIQFNSTPRASCSSSSSSLASLLFIVPVMKTTTTFN